jgi:hypothetical protein
LGFQQTNATVQVLHGRKLVEFSEIFFGQGLLYFITIGQDMLFGALETIVFSEFWSVFVGPEVCFSGLLGQLMLYFGTRNA